MENGSVAAAFFCYANFVLTGYLKDIEANRATQYKTFPVVFGWNSTIRAADVFAYLTLAFYWWPPAKNGWEIVFRAAGTLVLAYGQLTGHTTKMKHEKGALVPILCTVRSFLLLHIALVIHFQPQWWLPGLVYNAAFEWALVKRPSKFQV